MENDCEQKLDQNVIVRIADCGDSTLILRFIRELAEYERLLDSVVITEETLRQWISAGQVEVLIAEYDGKPAGYALYYYTYSTFSGQQGIYLEDLFVRPRFRQRGIGTQFFYKLVEIAKARNCFRIDWTVLDWNVNSIRFYEKLGAKAVTEWLPFRLHGAALDNIPSQNELARQDREVALI